MSRPTKQTSKDQFWKDEQGVLIPYSRTTAYERFCERKSNQLLSQAVKVHDQLTALKALVHEASTEAYIQFMDENNVDAKNRKGNLTWYNFDRSIKIEVSVKDKITFDEIGIAACKEKLDVFLDSNISSGDDMIKRMVMDAFETSRGNLDAKKVLSLLKYRKSVKNDNFQKAMELLENAIRYPESKTYFRIWAKNAEGEYQNIDLNFSSVKPAN